MDGISHSTAFARQVVDYAWGGDASALNPQPDVITGADILYEEQHFPALLKSIQALSAPHTLTYLAYRIRGDAHQESEGAPEALSPECRLELDGSSDEVPGGVSRGCCGFCWKC